MIGVMGCMAQKDQQIVFDRAPYVDMVVGPGQLHQIPTLLEKIGRGEGRQMAVSLGPQGRQPRTDPPQPRDVRSASRSDDAADSLSGLPADPDRLRQVLHLLHRADDPRPRAGSLTSGRSCPRPAYWPNRAARKSRLLGQTVNSYRYTDGEQTTRLADLLEQLHEIDGLERLKFVTNYPKDMTAAAAGNDPRPAQVLALPACARSKRPERRARADETRLHGRRLPRDDGAGSRRFCPRRPSRSDFIVGFCGETEEEFRGDVRAGRSECRFKNSFIFKYSERPGTKAAERLPDDVPREVKAQRNQRLLAVQDAISYEDQQQLIGQTFDVLVEGPSKKAVKAGSQSELVQMTGRTHCDRIVVFDGNRRQAGQTLPIKIDDASSHTLIGRVKTVELVSIGALKI